jgi:hypothetical protein
MDGVPTQTAGTSELLASDWNTYVRDNFDSIKFGHVVCTSSTRPTGIAEGTMIYETDTQKVLVYSGSAWVEISDIDRAGGLAETSPGHLIVADNTAKSALTASEGMMVYQSDNNKVFVYDGSSWVEVHDLDNSGGLPDSAPRGVLGKQTLTSSFGTSATHTTWQDTGLSFSVSYGANRTLKATCSSGYYTAGGTQTIGVRFVRGSTVFATFNINAVAVNADNVLNLDNSAYITTSSAATETFKVQLQAAQTNAQVNQYGDANLLRMFFVEDIGAS